MAHLVHVTLSAHGRHYQSIIEMLTTASENLNPEIYYKWLVVGSWAAFFAIPAVDKEDYFKISIVIWLAIF